MVTEKHRAPAWWARQEISQGEKSGASEGSLPTVLMLAGTLCDARIFARQKRALRGLADVQLINYNNLESVANWADRLLARLPERFSVVGFSLGGLIALELLRKAPHRMERLALLASNAQGAGRGGQRRSALMWKAWRTKGPTAVVGQAMLDYFHHAAQREQHSRLIHDMALGTPRKACAAQFRWAATRPEGLTALSVFSGPLLLVSGTKDRICTLGMQQAMVRAQPAAQWLALPRVGHFVSLEAPARLNHALRRWLVGT
jgi:pimeloyl-ACP methyl ester carboxylesterase